MIELDVTSHVLVLTGAGISAESGVPTFRGGGGIWDRVDVPEVASWHGFEQDPLKVWQFHSAGRAALNGIVPNAAHGALAALEAKLQSRFLLVTQNVDGLHTAAGNRRVIELHGNLMRSRCTCCDRPAFEDTTVYPADGAPVCARCDDDGRTALLRPDVVWFGESLPFGALPTIHRFMMRARKDLVFVAIGTSGIVQPAAGLVEMARQLGGRTWLVNLEKPDNVASFDHVVIGAASYEVPRLLA